MTFNRKISLSDLAYVSAGCRLSDGSQIMSQCVVEGHGEISKIVMEEAIKKVAVAMPGCRLIAKGSWGFKRWVASGPLPSFRTIERDWDGYDYDVDFLDKAMDIFKGPVIDIIQVKSKKTFIIIRVHHAVMDGIGAREFVRCLFYALNGKPLDDFSSAIIDEDIIPKEKTKKRSNTKLKPIEKTPLLREALTPFKVPATEEKIKTRKRAWVRISVDSNDLLMLPKTIIELADIARQGTSGQVRMHVPVDLRRHIPGIFTSANLTGMLALDIDEKETVRSLVRKLNAQLSINKEILNNIKFFARIARWMPIPFIERMAKRSIDQQLEKQRYRYSGMISALGLGDLEDCSTKDFTADTVFAVPVTPTHSPLFVTICINETSSEILLGAPLSLAANNRLEALGEDLRLRLNAVVKQAV